MSPQTSWILVNEVIPRLQSAIPRAVHCVGCEDHNELIQDGTAMAAKMLVNAEANRKKVTPGNVAYYTIQHLKSGRRSVGNSEADALATGTQMAGRSSIGSMEQEVAMDYQFDAPLTWNDLISIDTDDPAQKAARKLDWEAFIQSLDTRTETLLQWLAEGRTLSTLAEQWKVSMSRMVQIKTSLVAKMREYFGDDIWKVLAEQPQWKVNLMATRHYLTCRFERNAGANS